MSKHQGKSGSGSKRGKVIPLASSALGRRVAALEKRCLNLEGQRTMLVRAVGALVVAHGKVVDPDREEPAMLIPFVDMNVSRDIGFAIDRGETPGLVVAISKPVREQRIDSESEAKAFAEGEAVDPVAEAKDEAGG